VAPSKPETIDDYLATLSNEPRAALENLRRTIGKGTIRFPAERPLPDALVRKLVKTRIAQFTGGAEE
jgi:hypothetical protein